MSATLPKGGRSAAARSRNGTRAVLLLPALFAIAACGGGGGDDAAVTGVSGTVSHGSSVTITGSSFGTKSPPGPMLWDDFENGTQGGAVATGGASASPLLHQGDLANYSSYANSG